MASPRQKRKVKRVMHEYKHGALKSGRGRRGKVKSRRQAVAIAMSESGQSYKRRGKDKRKTTRSSASSRRRKSTTSRRTTRRKSTRGRKRGR